MQQLFKPMGLFIQENHQPRQDPLRSQKTTKYQKTQNQNLTQKNVHHVGPSYNHNLIQSDVIESDYIEESIPQTLKAIINIGVLKSHKRYSQEYIPYNQVIDNAYLKKEELRNLHFQHIELNSSNQSSLHKVIFKHNEQDKQIKFYIPTFLQFSLIKLHSEDLKNITHIENKNNMIIYINVYSKGLPKMIINKLTQKSKVKDVQEEPKLYFRANRRLFEAKYYMNYGDYMIFMFNPFCQNMIEFEIMKNVMFAPFEEAELILQIRINKKIFKLEGGQKTLRIARSQSQVNPFQADSPLKKKGERLSASILLQNQIMQQQHQQDEQFQRQQFDILKFDRIVLEFKLQKPKNILDSFRFHKSIEFGNYSIMTNQINIHIGTYESPSKKKELEEENVELNIDKQAIHEDELQDISSLRLSIGLYKHPVTDICTFFIPLTLAGGLTILLFHLCDHSLANQLQVLAIILVAYGSFIPQFRDRISMSRTVILVDFYIVYNMIPAVLCAIQSITESRQKKTYNSYQIISVIMYYISVLFLFCVYSLFLYVEKFYLKIHKKQMVDNFSTDVFNEAKIIEEEERSLSWFVLKNQRERAFFCEKLEYSKKKTRQPKFTRKKTKFYSKLQNRIQEQNLRQQQQELAESLALQIRISKENRGLKEIKYSEQQQNRNQKQKYNTKQGVYQTKIIQNQRHIHSFEKILSCKLIFLGILIIVLIVSGTIGVCWKRIIDKLEFEDLNKNCIHDDQEEKRLSRIENFLLNHPQKLGTLIQQNWNDVSVPVPIHFLQVRRETASQHQENQELSQNQFKKVKQKNKKSEETKKGTTQIKSIRHQMRQQE